MFLCKAWVMFKTSDKIIFSSKITHRLYVGKGGNIQVHSKKEKKEKVAHLNFSNK